MKAKLKAIEHRAISGAWLLGEDFEEIAISEDTYYWLWRNIYTICESPRLVKMFWANSSQYFEYRLSAVIPDSEFQNSKWIVTNQEKVDKRKNERNRFLEFHYAVGGLLLYQKQYQTIEYIFEYSQSLPPRYPLLPEAMHQIFFWFEHFGNEFVHELPVDLKYPFPDLDNLGNRRQINYWICCYVVVLFLRQYSLFQYYSYQNFTGQPHLPSDVRELSSWLDGVAYFERCLDDVLSNKKLIKAIEFEKIVQKNGENFSVFLKQLKNDIKNKIGMEKLNADLSEDKINAFYSKSNEIISKAFEEYNSIFIAKDAAHSDSELKLTINGEITLISKSAFTSNDIPLLDYDTFFASGISSNKIRRYIANAFFVSKTKRYLISKNNVLAALIKLIGYNKDVVIVGVNVSYQLKETLQSSDYKHVITYIPSTEYYSQDTLFVLRKKHLPAIEHKEIKKQEIAELQLQLINDKLKLYASVIDINKEGNEKVRDKWNLKNEPNNQDFKVQLALMFLSILYWKNDREIVQLNIASEYREEGIPNHLSDIEPLSDSNNS